jgi:hypothetical protein
LLHFARNDQPRNLIFKFIVTLKRFEKDSLIPLHPPLSKGGSISPPFGIFSLPKAGKGRWGGILECDFKQPN